MNFSSVSLDLLITIFSNASPQEIAKLSRVCNRFYTAARQPSLWQQKMIQYFPVETKTLEAQSLNGKPGIDWLNRFKKEYAALAEKFLIALAYEDEARRAQQHPYCSFSDYQKEMQRIGYNAEHIAEGVYNGEKMSKSYNDEYKSIIDDNTKWEEIPFEALEIYHKASLLSQLSALDNGFIKKRAQACVYNKAVEYFNSDKVKKINNVKCDKSGRTLFHWAALCDMPMDTKLVTQIQVLYSAIKENKIEILENIPFTFLEDVNFCYEMSLVRFALMGNHQTALNHFYKIAAEHLNSSPVNSAEIKQDKAGNTILHWAILCRQPLATVTLHLHLISQANKYGHTPLHLAALSGHISAAEWLLQRNAKLDARTGGNHEIYVFETGYYYIRSKIPTIYKHKEIFAGSATPIHIAAALGYLELVQFFLHEGANVDVPAYECKTPLHFACRNGHLAVAKCLIDHQASVNGLRDNDELGNEWEGDGQAPIHEAAAGGHVKVVELLLDNGEEINAIQGSQTTSPLGFAALNGHFETVQCLLNRGADINHRDDDTFQPLGYKTALNMAHSAGYTEIVRLLITKGANVNTVFFKAALEQKSGLNYLDFLKLVIECNANLYQTASAEESTVVDNALDLIIESKNCNDWSVENINAWHMIISKLFARCAEQIQQSNYNEFNRLQKAFIAALNKLNYLLISKCNNTAMQLAQKQGFLSDKKHPTAHNEPDPKRGRTNPSPT